MQPWEIGRKLKEVETDSQEYIKLLKKFQPEMNDGLFYVYLSHKCIPGHRNDDSNGIEYKGQYYIWNECPTCNSA